MKRTTDEKYAIVVFCNTERRALRLRWRFTLPALIVGMFVASQAWADRVRVTDTTIAPWSSIGQLEITDPTTGRNNLRCSGALVGPRHVLTAGHCVYAGGRYRTVRFFPGRNGLTNPFGGFDSVAIFPAPDWMTSSGGAERKDDFALVVLERPVGGGIGWFDLHSFKHRTWKRKSFTVAGYPGNEARGTLWRDSCKAKRAWPQIIKHKCSTSKGQSGGPMFRDVDGRPAIGAVQNWSLAVKDQAVRLTGGRIRWIRARISENP